MTRRIPTGRRKAYSWLGAGAASLGVGAALAIGPGVANADDGSGGGTAATRAADRAQPPRGGPRGARGPVAAPAASTVGGRVPRPAASARESFTPRAIRVEPVTAAPPIDDVAGAPTRASRPYTDSPAAAPLVVAVSEPRPVASSAAIAVTVPAPRAAPSSPAAAGSGPAPITAPGIAAAASAVAAVPGAVQARTLPTLPPGLARLLYRIVTSRGLNTPAAPADPIGSLLWGIFRRIETAYGLVPVPGTPTMSAPSLTTGAVSGQVGATVPAGLPLGYSVVTAPTQGSLTVDSTGYYAYKPAADATAVTDSFTVVANTDWAATNVTMTVPVRVPVTIPVSASYAIAVGAQPIDVVFTPGHRAYVTGSTDTWTGQGTVSVIDTATRAVGSTVGNGAIPTGIVVSPDGGTVYVSVYGRGDVTPPTVLAVDAATAAVTEIGAGRFPAGVAVSPDGGTAYVLDAYINEGDDAVWVIDTSTEALIAKVAVGSDPHGLAATPDGSHVYVLNRGNGQLGSATMSVIDTQPGSPTVNTVTATIKVGDEPVGLAVSPDGKHVYVADLFDGSIRVIDTATSTVGATIRLGATVGGIAVSPDGKRVYVADARGAVAVIDATTNTLVGSIPVAGAPTGVAVNPDGSEIYVVKNYDQSLSVIAV